MTSSDKEFGEELQDDAFDTVATVPLSRPLNLQRRYPPTASATKSPSPSHVQVHASSPQISSPSADSPGPLSSPPVPSHVGRLMAPPGTQFRAPSTTYSQGRRSETAECFTQGERDVVEVSSSEDEATRPTGLKKSAFVRNGVPISRVQESPVRFSQFAHHEPPGLKRSADAMAEAYGGRERERKLPRKLPPPPRQTAPSKAMSVSSPSMALGDIESPSVRQKVQNMNAIFPDVSIAKCMDVLLKKHNNYDDALGELASLNDSKPIDLTTSDDELQRVQEPRPTAKMNVKRDVGKSKTIQEKWTKQKATDGQGSPVAPRRKKLVRPPKTYSPTRSSPVRSPPRVGVVEDDITVLSSDGEEEESQKMEDHAGDVVEVEFLGFLNACAPTDLEEVASQPRDVIDLVLSHRPFKTLDEVRRVTITSTSTTKKRQTKTITKDVGDRLVDACLEVFRTYATVDRLVKECEDLGRPIRSEMSHFGLDSSANGELEITDFDHDSGIGTPNSSIDGRNEAAVRSRPSKRQRLRQPRTMSSTLTMKDYQIIGLNWLALLFSKGMSGILADDMGLGKTCQVVSFLTHLVESNHAGPHLVIVPGSTLENWLREFSNFSPDLDVRPYYGSQKERMEMQLAYQEDVNNINVIVTTYDMATARDDNRFLRRLQPTVCVFDEGHALKNSKSIRYRSLMRIPAQFRLLLTGTPLQNNLQELISLLAFIMPGVFQDHLEDLDLLFKHKAKTSEGDNGRAALLSMERINRARSMMTPFILRRKKEQVMKHLPAKLCRVEYCDMSKAQSKLYAEEAAKATNALGQGVTMKQRTNVLMDLRKAAIHPLLFRKHYRDKDLKKLARLYMQGCTRDSDVREELVEEDLQVMTDFELNRFCRKEGPKWRTHVLPETAFLDSGKVEALVKILKKHKTNGDRTLVFSQFTMVMDILEEVFQHEDIVFSRLDGSTKMTERQDLIDQFEADTNISVFMLSTKAGGAGINLACANKVVIFDSSFNPQDDVQAENRAHRVGQTREVEVIRLVTRGTIEMQIMALGQTKLALDDRVAGVKDAAGEEGGRGRGKGKPKDIEPALDEGELQGMAFVEKMLMKKGDGDRDELARMHNDATAARADLKDEFMNGLKEAGLRVKSDNV